MEERRLLCVLSLLEFRVDPVDDRIAPGGESRPGTRALASSPPFTSLKLGLIAEECLVAFLPLHAAVLADELPDRFFTDSIQAKCLQHRLDLLDRFASLGFQAAAECRFDGDRQQDGNDGSGQPDPQKVEEMEQPDRDCGPGSDEEPVGDRAAEGQFAHLLKEVGFPT